MRFGMIGDNPIEKAVLASGLLPTPMLESYAMVTTRALLAAARDECDLVVMTLFVNPTQFGPNEDLSRYIL